MFAFFDGNPARTNRMMDVGFMPWWVYPGMRASFWRPLTVLTHLLDYRLCRSAWLMHAQSLAWVRRAGGGGSPAVSAVDAGGLGRGARRPALRG